MATAGPASRRIPDLVMEQPFARPRQDRVGDGHGRIPLAGQVQAQRAIIEDVRQPSLTGWEFKRGVPDPRDWLLPLPVGDLDCVVARDLAGLQLGCAGQLVAADGAARLRERLAQPVGLLRQVQSLTCHRWWP